MYDYLLHQLKQRAHPVDVIMSGLGFMGFGFLSALSTVPGMRVPLLLSRRPKEAKAALEMQGFRACFGKNKEEIHASANNGYIAVSDNIALIKEVSSDVVFEVTGTVSYATEVVHTALEAKKHVVTMNPELQATTGTKLKQYAQKQGILFTDVVGDQPGSLSQLITRAQLQGFRVRLAGNMKRFMNFYATQKEMQPWADDKGLSVRQTTSFTDGTKQSIEMTLVANYFGMNIAKRGMTGFPVESIAEILSLADIPALPPEGIVDYCIGRTLFPGVFIVVEHKDRRQQKYLRYLGLGEGPYYVLFEPYHLCHLDVPFTIAKLVLLQQETIHNSIQPRMQTIAIAKRDLAVGEMLDGIGGDMVYGAIDRITHTPSILPVGLAEGAHLTKPIKKDMAIPLSHVSLAKNAATKLLRLA